MTQATPFRVGAQTASDVKPASHIVALTGVV